MIVSMTVSKSSRYLRCQGCVTSLPMGGTGMLLDIWMGVSTLDGVILSPVNGAPPPAKPKEKFQRHAFCRGTATVPLCASHI